MTKKAAKVGDIGTDHDGFPSTPIIAGSSNVFIDGRPAARVNDPLEEHCKAGNSPHSRHIISGSSTVFINKLPLAITGSAISCGGNVVGSGTVFVGDNPPDSAGLISLKGMFDEAFTLTDQKTGEPVTNREYRILRADGRYEYGKTDDKGHTHTVFGLSPDELSIEIRDE